jgi:hypothetical protein
MSTHSVKNENPVPSGLTQSGVGGNPVRSKESYVRSRGNPVRSSGKLKEYCKRTNRVH